MPGKTKTKVASKFPEEKSTDRYQNFDEDQNIGFGIATNSVLGQVVDALTTTVV